MFFVNIASTLLLLSVYFILIFFRQKNNYIYKHFIKVFCFLHVPCIKKAVRQTHGLFLCLKSAYGQISTQTFPFSLLSTHASTKRTP